MISITVTDKNNTIYSSWEYDIVILDKYIWVYEKDSLAKLNKGEFQNIQPILFPQDITSVESKWEK